MNSYSPEQTKAILNLATQKTLHLTESELFEVARRSDIPDWCVQAALEELEEMPDLLDYSDEPSIAVNSTGSEQKPLRCLIYPIGLLSGLLLLMSFVIHFFYAEVAQFPNCESNAHSPLEAELRANTALLAQHNLETAIDSSTPKQALDLYFNDLEK